MDSPTISKESMIRALDCLSDACRKYCDGRKVLDEKELTRLISSNKDALRDYARFRQDENLLELSMSIPLPSNKFFRLDNRMKAVLIFFIVGLLGISLSYFILLFWVFSPILLLLFCFYSVWRYSAQNRRFVTYRQVAEKAENAKMLLSNK